MRFHRLDLIKYGKFSDHSVEFPVAKQDFHLIVGPNEAGKSTLRSAIIDLLFGIPTRSVHSFLHPLRGMESRVVPRSDSACVFTKRERSENAVRLAW